MLLKSTRSKHASRKGTGASGLTIGLLVSVAAAGVSVQASESDSVSGTQLTTSQTTLSRAVSNGMPNRTILISRTRELMEADNREIDEVAKRLKRIIEARYEADLLNAESLATIEELRRKIAEYEALLKEARDNQQLLNADKAALEDRLKLAMGERDSALDRVGVLGNRIDEQRDAAAIENALTRDELDNTLNELGLLSNKLDAQRNAAKDRVADLQRELDQKENALGKLRDQLADANAEKKQLEDALAANRTILDERNNKLSRLNGLMTKKEDALGLLERQLGDNTRVSSDLQKQIAELTGERDDANGMLASVKDQLDEKSGKIKDMQDQINLLAGQRDSARKEVTGVNGLLAKRADEIASLEDQLAELGAQRADALGQIDQLRQSLASSEDTAGNFLTERNELADALSLLENKAADAGNSFISEQQAHTQTRANLFALQREADALRKDIARLNGEKDSLLNDASRLKSSRAELGGQLAALKKELDTRQNELQAALSSIANLNGSIAGLEKERELLTAKVDELNDQQVALKGELDKTRSGYESQIADANLQHSNELKALEAELAAKNQGLALLEKDMDAVAKDFTGLQSESSSVIAEKEQEIDDLNARIAEITAVQEQLELARRNDGQEIENLRRNINALTASRDEFLEASEQLQLINDKLAADLSDANSKFDKLKADGEIQLAGFEKEIMGLIDARDGQSDKISGLESLNQELADKLSNNRKKLDLVTAQGTEKLRVLGEELDRLQSREKLYKANLLESGKKLQEIAGLNQSLTSELADERARYGALAQELGEARLQLDGYESELYTANEKLRQLMDAQRLAEQERDRIAADAEQLRVSLTSELDKAKLENITVQKARADNSIPVTLGNADFFETGSARLTKEGGEKLTRLANIIHSYHDKRIVVEGHTDDVPIGPGLLTRYASNWELSVARAAAAVRHMQANTDIEPDNLSAAGYGEYKPIGDNTTEEGRQLNRRVEVVLYPREVEIKNIDDLGTITAIDE